MPVYESFEAALSQALGEATRPPGAVDQVGTTPWVDLIRAGRCGHGLAARRAAGVARAVTPVAEAPQARALAEFARLGVRLHRPFTTRELRRAYRALARAVHPDRHPGLDPADQARLTDEFAAINAHYRLLLSLAVDAN